MNQRDDTATDDEDAINEMRCLQNLKSELEAYIDRWQVSLASEQRPLEPLRDDGNGRPQSLYSAVQQVERKVLGAELQSSFVQWKDILLRLDESSGQEINDFEAHESVIGLLRKFLGWVDRTIAQSELDQQYLAHEFCKYLLCCIKGLYTDPSERLRFWALHSALDAMFGGWFPISGSYRRRPSTDTISEAVKTRPVCRSLETLLDNLEDSGIGIPENHLVNFDAMSVHAWVEQLPMRLYARVTDGIEVKNGIRIVDHFRSLENRWDELAKRLPCGDGLPWGELESGLNKEWAAIRNGGGTSGRAKTDLEAASSDQYGTTCDGLSGGSLKLFQYLYGREQYTYWDDLNEAGVFTKSDMTPKGIESAITRLITALEKLNAPYLVEHSTADKRVKVISKPPSN